ncbi:MAG: aspartate-alanine antiporter [Muribaculaceae bacterium]|nr:aspartate-alanine antiporter [Muribaculaceae bacterium]
MNNILDILREYPAITIFLTVGIGFFVGKLRYKTFSLGSVTAVLLVSILIGQIGVPVSGPIKTVFFMMFLFSIGYSVGPTFFRSLRGMGLKQVLFAVIMSLMCGGVTLVLALLFKYGPGITVGLFSGSQTCSSVIGVGSETIQRLGNLISDPKEQQALIPVCYAVTYIYGTLGTVIILGSLGPKLLGGLDKVKEQTRALEEELNMSDWENDPAYINALREVSFRAYIIDEQYFDTPRTVAEAEKFLHDNAMEVSIDRVRINGEVKDATADLVLHKGDVVVLCGRYEQIINDSFVIGPETADEELLHYPVERVPVLLANKKLDGYTVEKLNASDFMHGVTIRTINRKGENIDLSPEVELHKGDVLTIIGQSENVRVASDELGHMDRPTLSSDLMFVGLAIAIGGIMGALTFMIGSIPLSFGTSGGALVAGLVFGWLRSKRPSFGHIPRSALWIMNNLGLNVFIACIGLESAQSFVSGLVSVGPMLFVVGIIATSLPLLFGLWLGHKVFKFNPALTLGCCAGTRTCTASLGAVQDTLGSTLPAMGYTVTYAVANILLVIWGLLAVIIVH